MRGILLASLALCAVACDSDPTSNAGPVVGAEILPADTVIKTPTALVGHGVDEAGVANNSAAVTWESLTPTVVTVDQTGLVTPVSTGIGQIRITVETFTAEATVRSVSTVAAVGDLLPLFPYTAGTSPLVVRSDVSQSDADTRSAAFTGPYTQWSGLFNSTPAATEVFFTDWRPIWTEFLAFCAGVDDPERAAHAFCGTPPLHVLLAVDENETGIRFLGQQFMSLNYADADAFPWLKEGWSSFVAGGEYDETGLLGLPSVRQVIIDDFNAADDGGGLEALSALLNMPAADFYAGAPTRAPVRQMVAQATMFWAWLVTEEGGAAGVVFNLVRNGSTATNGEVLGDMFAELGMDAAEVEALYLAWARSR